MSSGPEVFTLATLRALPQVARRIAIGNFDGVHRGHQCLLAALGAASSESGAIRCALTFYPHPAVVLAPARAPEPLYSLEERVRQLKACGADEVVVLRFDEELSRLSAEEFAAKVLAEALRAEMVVVGDNFRYAKGQQGDIRTLAAHGEHLGFTVAPQPLLMDRGVPVSSSQIRRLLLDGRAIRAARLLGRPYQLSGAIISGRGVGRTQTVPTLNLQVPSTVIPANGVYVTRAISEEQGITYMGVTNVGYRPTFQDGHPERSIETFVLGPLLDDPSAIRLDILAKLRDEQRFESPEALKQQIMRDVGRAQSFHRRVLRWQPNALALTRV